LVTVTDKRSLAGLDNRQSKAKARTTPAGRRGGRTVAGLDDCKKAKLSEADRSKKSAAKQRRAKYSKAKQKRTTQPQPWDPG
jgi:hypothetical protein